MSLRDWLRDLFHRPEPPAPNPAPPDPEPGPAPQPGPGPSDDIAEQLLQEHNEYRAGRGRSPLALNAKLCKAAQAHANWMNQRSALRHTGFPGWLRDVGYAYSSCGENIAWNYKNAEACTRAWMSDAGHRANVLGHFAEAGFAKVGAYWCGIYASPATTGVIEAETSGVPCSSSITMDLHRHQEDAP